MKAHGPSLRQINANCSAHEVEQCCTPLELVDGRRAQPAAFLQWLYSRRRGSMQMINSSLAAGFVKFTF